MSEPRNFSNIRNQQAFMDNTPDWSIFNGAFSNKKVRIGDLDGAIERAGHLLILEVKSPGKSIPLGQSIMFKNLSKAGTATVFVLWGKNDVYNAMRVYTEDGKYREYEDIDNDFIEELIQKWERWAIKHSKV